jgi:hypothetical protein
VHTAVRKSRPAHPAYRQPAELSTSCSQFEQLCNGALSTEVERAVAQMLAIEASDPKLPNFNRTDLIETRAEALEGAWGLGLWMTLTRRGYGNHSEGQRQGVETRFHNI